MQDKEFVVSRQELYEQVWSEPMVAVAKRYNISDVGLAKVCRRHNIPIPPRGFWARKQAGYRVKQTPLPAKKDNRQIDICGQGKREKILVTKEAKEVQQKIQKALVVPKTLRNPHPLIQRTMKLFGSEKNPNDQIVKMGRARTLDIGVTPRNRSRAFLLFDTLLKALEREKLEMAIDETGTYVVISDIKIYFGLREKLKMVFREPDEWELRFGRDKVRQFVPSNSFLLAIKGPWVSGGKKEWQDGKKMLEEQLGGFVEGLFEHSVRAKKEEEERQERCRRREEEERIRAQRLARIKAEEEKFSQLMQLVECWQQSTSIRQFAAAMEKKVHEKAMKVDAEWLAWVRKQADRIDPLVPDSPGSDAS